MSVNGVLSTDAPPVGKAVADCRWAAGASQPAASGEASGAANPGVGGGRMAVDKDGGPLVLSALQALLARSSM